MLLLISCLSYIVFVCVAGDYESKLFYIYIPSKSPFGKGGLVATLQYNQLLCASLYLAANIVLLFGFTIAARKILRIVNLKVVVGCVLANNHAGVVELNSQVAAVEGVLNPIFITTVLNGCAVL